jgi:hypothetical protein
MKKHILLSLGLCLGIISTTLSQFEGVIEFEKIVGKVTINYKYFVKGDNIRVEEVDEKKKLEGVELINIKQNTIYALSPDRKLYMEIPQGRPNANSVAAVEKTKETKTINNETCTKWVVKNPEQDRIVNYWMAKGDYDFFVPMLKTLNRKEKIAVYYLQMDGTEGYFPMLGEETKMDGTPVSSLEVKSITRKTLDNNLFEIPKGYTKFER